MTKRTQHKRQPRIKNTRRKRRGGGVFKKKLLCVNPLATPPELVVYLGEVGKLDVQQAKKNIDDQRNNYLNFEHHFAKVVKKKRARNGA